jgi:hypothetical protein
LVLGACALADPQAGRPIAPDDPAGRTPVAFYISALSVDEIAQCVSRRWGGLTALAAPETVSLHPSFRGLMVSVRGSTDPAARAFVDIFPFRGYTRVEYFLRDFSADDLEDLRYRTLVMCLQ